MGRIRKTLAWTFSPGGNMKGLVRAESSAERAAREAAEARAAQSREQARLFAEQNRLLAEQNRLISEQQQTSRPTLISEQQQTSRPTPAVGKTALQARIDAMYTTPEERWRAGHVPGSKEDVAVRRPDS